MAIIDFWDRHIVGWRPSKPGLAKIAAATLDDALRSRKVDPPMNELTLRSAFCPKAVKYSLQRPLSVSSREISGCDLTIDPSSSFGLSAEGAETAKLISDGLSRLPDGSA